MWCEGCSKSKSARMFQPTVRVLRSFRTVRLITLTVDPKLHAGPGEAYLAMRGTVSRLMQDLKRGGYLWSSRYFAVIETHKTGWPHWHIIVDAPDIPHEILSALWAKQGGGFCYISRGPNGRAFKNKDHAAHYALKYLRKQPAKGWPAWILDGGLKIRRYMTSQNFFDGGAKRRSPGESPRDAKIRKGRLLKKKTHRVRIAGCCSSTAVFGVTLDHFEDGEIRQRLQHLATLKMPRSELLGRMGCDPDHQGRWEVPLALVRTGEPAILFDLVKIARDQASPVYPAILERSRSSGETAADVAGVMAF